VAERRLTAAYLQRLIASVLDDERSTIELRNECHRLMMVITTNNHADVSEAAERVEALVRRAGIHLPRQES
jgi:hypothetical protein